MGLVSWLRRKGHWRGRKARLLLGASVWDWSHGEPAEGLGVGYAPGRWHRVTDDGRDLLKTGSRPDRSFSFHTEALGPVALKAGKWRLRKEAEPGVP